MKQTRIIGLLIRDRIKEAGRLQNILSSHSGLIKSRLGFHELNENTCSRSGVVLLTLSGDESSWSEFEQEIMELEGVEMQSMSFIQ